LLGSRHRATVARYREELLPRAGPAVGGVAEKAPGGGGRAAATPEVRRGGRPGAGPGEVGGVVVERGVGAAGRWDLGLGGWLWRGCVLFFKLRLGY